MNITVLEIKYLGIKCTDAMLTARAMACFYSPITRPPSTSPHYYGLSMLCRNDNNAAFPIQ